MLQQAHHADEAKQPEREQAVVQHQPAAKARLGVWHQQEENRARSA
jgi:hypothetical protein